MENHLIKIYFPSPTEFISEKLKNPTDTIQFNNSRNHEIAEKLDLSLKEYELSSFGIDEIFSLKFINFLKQEAASTGDSFKLFFPSISPPNHGPIFLFSRENQIMLVRSSLDSALFEYDTSYETGPIDSELVEQVLLHEKKTFKMYQISLACERVRFSSKIKSKNFVFLLDDANQIPILSQVRTAFPTEEIWLQISEEVTNPKMIDEVKKQASRYHLKTHAFPKGINIELKKLVQ